MTPSAPRPRYTAETVPGTFMKPQVYLDYSGAELGQDLIKSVLASVATKTPGVGFLAGGIVTLLLSKLWPTANDPWEAIEGRVKAVVKQAITELYQKIVDNQLAGLKKLYTDYADKAVHGSKESARDAWRAARSAILNDYPAFTDKDYGYATLPLFAQMANLHICLLRDGIQNGDKIEFSADDITWMQKELTDIAVKHGDGKYGSYTQYVYDTYEAGLKNNNVEDKVGYQREMHWSAVEYARFFWPALGDPSNTPESVWRQYVVYFGPWGAYDTGYDEWLKENTPYARNSNPGHLIGVESYALIDKGLPTGFIMSYDGSGKGENPKSVGDTDDNKRVVNFGKVEIHEIEIGSEGEYGNDHLHLFDRLYVCYTQDGSNEYKEVCASYEGNENNCHFFKFGDYWKLCELSIVDTSVVDMGDPDIVGNERQKTFIRSLAVGVQPREQSVKPEVSAPLKRDGHYAVLSRVTGQALDLARISTDDTVPVILRDHDGADSQVWQFRQSDGGAWQLVNAYNGRVLAGGDGPTATTTATPDLLATTHWNLDPNPARNTVHRIVSAQRDLLLAPAGTGGPAVAALSAPPAAIGDDWDGDETAQASQWMIVPVPDSGPVAEARAARPALYALPAAGDATAGKDLPLVLDNPPDGTVVDGSWHLEFLLPAEAGTALTTAESDTVTVTCATAEERGIRVTIAPTTGAQNLAPGQQMTFTLTVPPSAPALLPPAAARLNGAGLRSTPRHERLDARIPPPQNSARPQ